MKKKILDLLADRVYIPVYRVEDSSMPGMAIPVVEFSREGYKIRNQMKSLNFANWLNGE